MRYADGGGPGSAPCCARSPAGCRWCRRLRGSRTRPPTPAQLSPRPVRGPRSRWSKVGLVGSSAAIASISAWCSAMARSKGRSEVFRRDAAEGRRREGRRPGLEERITGHGRTPSWFAEGGSTVMVWDKATARRAQAACATAFGQKGGRDGRIGTFCGVQESWGFMETEIKLLLDPASRSIVEAHPLSRRHGSRHLAERFDLLRHAGPRSSATRREPSGAAVRRKLRPDREGSGRSLELRVSRRMGMAHHVRHPRSGRHGRGRGGHDARVRRPRPCRARLRHRRRTLEANAHPRRRYAGGSRD